MTTLERLLRGDEATWNGYTIINVVDYSEKYDCFYPIYIIYIQDGDIYGTSLNEDNINNGGLITFTKTKKPRTIEDGLKVGDIIENNNNSRKILAVVDLIYIVSNSKNYGTANISFTLGELIESKYKLKQPKIEDEVIELTIQDISEGKGKGIDPKLIRIKG